MPLGVVLLRLLFESGERSLIVAIPPLIWTQMDTDFQDTKQKELTEKIVKI
jgi:hypothetical protein